MKKIVKNLEFLKYIVMVAMDHFRLGKKFHLIIAEKIGTGIFYFPAAVNKMRGEVDEELAGLRSINLQKTSLALDRDTRPRGVISVGNYICAFSAKNCEPAIEEIIAITILFLLPGLDFSQAEKEDAIDSLLLTEQNKKILFLLDNFLPQQYHWN